jgi:hypothetical protein
MGSHREGHQHQGRLIVSRQLRTLRRRLLALTDRTGMSALTVAKEGNADSICSP